MLSLAIRSYVTDRVTLSQMQGVHGDTARALTRSLCVLNITLLFR